MRHTLLACALLAALAAALVALAPGGSAPPAHAAGPSLPAWAAEIAQRVAAANGDAAPSRVEFALTTPARAATVTGDVSSDDESAVYAVVMRGAFTLYAARRPHGSPPMSADWILLVLDPRTRSVDGTAASGGVPDTGGIGAMTLAPIR